MRTWLPLLGVGLCLSSVATAKTWVVDQKNEAGADFTSITSAIASAANGDTIEVRPGVYEEELKLDKKIVKLIALEGPDKTTVTGPPTILTISSPGAAGTLIRGFRFSGAAAGAVRVTNAIVTLEGNRFESNGTTEQPIQGGALWAAAQSQITLLGNTFASNHAADGGAVYVETGKLLVDGDRFLDNGAAKGAAIYAETAEVSVKRAFFCGGSASEAGGGMAVEQSTLDVVASLFVDGTAPAGGAMWLSSVAGAGGPVALQNIGITSGSGGGIVVGPSTNVAVRNAVFDGVDGGAVSLAGGTMTVTYSLFHGNGPAHVVDGDGAALPDPEGTGVILGADPLLVASDSCAPGAYEHSPKSPMVDAGDPTLKDKDKTRSDMGPYGGPDGVDPVLDGDKDTVPDLRDNCPEHSNLDQKDTDSDGIGDVCDETSGVTDDKDKDGVKDVVDNCPNNYNPEQLDTDGDGLGDVCDANKDGDPVPDIGDCAPLDKDLYPGNQETCNGLDDDCDGIVDEGLSCQAEAPDAGAGGEDAGGEDVGEVPTPVDPGSDGDGGCGSTGGGAGALWIALLGLRRRRRA
ncbi:MAG: hypothetical protein AMXMBFR64_00900 [Myxococcales bacterium]